MCEYSRTFLKRAHQFWRGSGTGLFPWRYLPKSEAAALLEVQHTHTLSYIVLYIYIYTTIHTLCNTQYSYTFSLSLYMTCRHACNTWVLHRMYVWTTYAYTRPDPQTILIAGFWFLIHRGQPSKTVILYTHMYTHIITHMLLYIYTCNMWTYLPKLRDLYTYAYIYMYTYIFTHKCAYIYIYIYIHTYNIHIYNIYIDR